jgi:hypothetical protein
VIVAVIGGADCAGMDRGQIWLRHYNYRRRSQKSIRSELGSFLSWPGSSHSRYGPQLTRHIDPWRNAPSPSRPSELGLHPRPGGHAYRER